jgi:hypothetical protein
MSRARALCAVLAAVTCTYTLSSPASAQGPTATPLKMALFITTPERDGFMEIDRAIADSTKDLARAFDRMAEVRLVQHRREAELVLTVSTRGVGNQARGEMSIAVPLGKRGVIESTTQVVQSDYWLSTVLEVGPTAPTYQKEFLGQSSNLASGSMGAWSTCARMVAQDVQAWIVGNRVQLDGLRWLRNRR